MSASERLKALETQWPKSQLDEVLPQIVAVVEAAETFINPVLTPGVQQGLVLDAALSALEEALS